MKKIAAGIGSMLSTFAFAVVLMGAPAASEAVVSACKSHVFPPGSCRCSCGSGNTFSDCTASTAGKGCTFCTSYGMCQKGPGGGPILW